MHTVFSSILCSHLYDLPGFDDLLGGEQNRGGQHTERVFEEKFVSFGFWPKLG